MNYWSQLSTVVHEIGHALGFFHEQSRSDRDDYVLILEDNIQEEGLKDFKKRETLTYNVPYDYGSIMHYTDRVRFLNNC